ncbi:c-type cytochrome [Bradyrhizobium sp. Y36]|uniref:c-type cytochrome n=1 Tax=Bradyrhizobium sp. Y36 TaxID=2035447 RepID=UPI0013044A34|nr:c-type cytochrome [Bradyrhizobium sp. Y36]
MKTIGILATLAFLVTAPAALAQTSAAPSEGQAATASPGSLDGKSLFRAKTCVACHGRDGAKAIQNYPDLAGQDAKYMLAQMAGIADGSRVSGPDARGYPRTQGMKDVMHLTSTEERAAIAEFLASQPAAKPRPLDPAPDSARLAAGKDAYLKSGCGTCHGPDGSKPLASYPQIAGQKRDYVALQMTEIRDGVRKGGKVATMLPFAKKLDDAKIALIADYLSQVERGPK